MRKMIVLGALALVAATAFAQNAPAPAPALVFSGALYTGTIAQSFDNATATLGIWDPVNQTKSRFNFQGAYAGTGFGLNFRLREDDNWNQGNNNVNTSTTGNIPSAPGFRRLYGYIDAAGGLVRVAAGRLAGYEWATGDAGGFNTLGNLDGAVGMQLQIKPMDGVNVGTFLPFTYGNSKALVSQLNLDEALNSMAFGAKYTIKGLGDIEGGYWLAPNMSTANATTSSNFYSYPKAWFGGEYTGMQNLTAILETQYSLARIASANYAYLAETVGYQMDQLMLTLYAEQQFNASSSFGTNLAFRPNINYTLGQVDVGAFVEILYVTGDNFYGDGTAYNGHLGYSGGPYVKMTFAKNVYMKLMGELGGGDVTPPTFGAPFVSFPGNIGSPYQEKAGWAPLQGSFWQVGLNFVVSF